MATATVKSTKPVVAISPPDFQTIALNIVGTAPLVINKFSAKAAEKMRLEQEAGSTAKSKKNRDPKDFEELFNGARHIGRSPILDANGKELLDANGKLQWETWDGIHAASFRNAAISACRAAGFVMTRAKLAIFTEADGFDIEDKTPLVRLTQGEPEMVISPCRNANGNIDLRPRPTYLPLGCHSPYPL